MRCRWCTRVINYRFLYATWAFNFIFLNFFFVLIECWLMEWKKEDCIVCYLSGSITIKIRRRKIEQQKRKVMNVSQFSTKTYCFDSRMAKNRSKFLSLSLWVGETHIHWNAFFSPSKSKQKKKIFEYETIHASISIVKQSGAFSSHINHLQFP